MGNSPNLHDFAGNLGGYFLPENLQGRVVSGFSENDLRRLCDGDWAHHPTGVPWRYWDTELYSQGELIREMAGWPSWLPIPVSGDHGPMPGCLFWPRGYEAGLRDYLTTSPIKLAAAVRPKRLRVHLIRSPWVEWIRRHNIAVREDAEGTLAFVPHLQPGLTHDDAYIATLVAELTSLPREFHPVVACVHMHDIRHGLGKALRKHGLPVVSAGNTSHPSFIGRWAEIAQHFKFATSPQPGSELLLFHSMGGSFFVFGAPSETWAASPQAAQQEEKRNDVERYLDQSHSLWVHKLFPFPPDSQLRPRQDAYLSIYVDKCERLTPSQLRRLFYRRLPFLGLAYLIRYGGVVWKNRKVLTRLRVN